MGSDDSQSKGIRFGKDEWAVYEELARRLGISTSSWIRIAARRMAEQDLEKEGKRPPWRD